LKEQGRRWQSERSARLLGDAPAQGRKGEVGSYKEPKEVRMYTKEQIAKGLDLANQWYEGWRLDEIDIGQLYECIEKANLPITGDAPAGE
jgi:hypothetical protein